MSLGKVIQTLDPNANAKAEVKKANKEAEDDLKDRLLTQLRLNRVAQAGMAFWLSTIRLESCES